jgi:hypothetical protein
LLLGLFGRRQVERASFLLAVKKTRVLYIVTTGNHRPHNLSLLAVNFFLRVLVLAIADVCHRTQYYEQVIEQSERGKYFLPDS